LADRLVRIVEDYFSALRDAHRTGAGTPERTYYPAVNNLLNAIGADLKPRVHCISDLGNTGAGKAVGLSLDEVLALLGETTFDIHLNGYAW
jgi:hypothetical protein